MGTHKYACQVCKQTFYTWGKDVLCSRLLMQQAATCNSSYLKQLKQLSASGL